MAPTNTNPPPAEAPPAATQAAPLAYGVLTLECDGAVSGLESEGGIGACVEAATTSTPTHSPPPSINPPGPRAAGRAQRAGAGAAEAHRRPPRGQGRAQGAALRYRQRLHQVGALVGGSGGIDAPSLPPFARLSLTPDDRQSTHDDEYDDSSAHCHITLEEEDGDENDPTGGGKSWGKRGGV